MLPVHDAFSLSRQSVTVQCPYIIVELFVMPSGHPFVTSERHCLVPVHRRQADVVVSSIHNVSLRRAKSMRCHPAAMPFTSSSRSRRAVITPR